MAKSLMLLDENYLPSDPWKIHKQYEASKDQPYSRLTFYSIAPSLKGDLIIGM